MRLGEKNAKVVEVMAMLVGYHLKICPGDAFRQLLCIVSVSSERGKNINRESDGEAKQECEKDHKFFYSKTSDQWQ